MTHSLTQNTSYTHNVLQCNKSSSSLAVARRAEQIYRDMVNGKLDEIWDEINKPNYKGKPMPADFGKQLCERVRARQADEKRRV